MAEKKLDRFTVDEYLVLESRSEIKNEYEQGAIIAMSGGTLNHGIIGNNINTLLSNSVQSKGVDCVTINGDVRIFIEKADSFVYPDGMMICSLVKPKKCKESVEIRDIFIGISQL